MPVHNTDIASCFNQLADLLEIEGANPFRVRAYRNAARTVASYFTGSRAHTIAVRQLGQARHLKINEYGVFRGKKRLAGRSEHEVYAQVDLPYIEPELREDQGEIEAARQHQLPILITHGDVVGDLHAHTRATDGRNSLEEMAKAAQARGYQYLAITDHSQRLRVTNGLDARRLRRQLNAIDRLNAKLDGIVLLKAISGRWRARFTRRYPQRPRLHRVLGTFGVSSVAAQANRPPYPGHGPSVLHHSGPSNRTFDPEA